MNFWENVEYIREFRDMTRKELAYKADFSINSISTGIARGSFPAVDVACRIAKVLDVSVEFLVNGDVMKMPKNLEKMSVEQTAKDGLEKKFQNMQFCLCQALWLGKNGEISISLPIIFRCFAMKGIPYLLTKLSAHGAMVLPTAFVERMWI